MLKETLDKILGGAKEIIQAQTRHGIDKVTNLVVDLGAAKEIILVVTLLGVDKEISLVEILGAAKEIILVVTPLGVDKEINLVEILGREHKEIAQAHGLHKILVSDPNGTKIAKQATLLFPPGAEHKETLALARSGTKTLVQEIKA
jgi:hypothetical protein